MAISFTSLHRNSLRIGLEEWQKHKETIIGLYMTGTLGDITQVMEREHGFKATYDAPRGLVATRRVIVLILR